MGDMREALREGDQTTTGGILRTSGPALVHDNRSVAGEGDLASCPACKSEGPVKNDACPSSTLPDGRQILVRGARVMCACSDKPLIIPSQHVFTIEVNRSATPVGAGSASVNPRAPANQETAFDEAFILKDRTTGAVLANVEYRIRFADGTFEYGVTDANGLTHVATTADSETLILEVRT